MEENNAIVWIREDGEWMLTVPLKAFFQKSGIAKPTTPVSNVTNKVNDTNSATEEQIKYMKDLGFNPPSNMTKREAQLVIKELLDKKAVSLKNGNVPKVSKEEFEEFKQMEYSNDLNKEEFPDY